MLCADRERSAVPTEPGDRSSAVGLAAVIIGGGRRQEPMHSNPPSGTPPERYRAAPEVLAPVEGPLTGKLA
jgi:hypothetical protein